MNKIRLFKINCIISSLFLISLMAFTQKSYAESIISNNGVTIEQNIKEQNVTINLKNQPLKNFLYEIQKQSGISFAFNENDFPKELSSLSLQVKDMSVEKALNQLLSSTGYTYKVVGSAITIVKRPETQKPSAKFTLSGKVIDGSTKRPVVGATVIVAGTSTGAITDDKGAYSVSITVGQTLEVSFVGMKPYTKKIESEIKELNITMELDQMNIDNVVVTGQANISKNSFTGNAKTIKGEDLLKVSRTNVIKALQTFDPSFKIAENIQFGSDPNALPEVYIRGRSSLGAMELDRDKLSKNNMQNNPNTPTFIMDGFEVDMQKVYDMDPNRIQSMTILKDAAATAMYGSRAANGVVVITTVPAKDGKIRVSYNLTTSLEVPDLSDYNLMNAAEKLEAERLAGVYDNINGQVGMDPTKANLYWRKWTAINVEGVDTDWLSKPLRTAFEHKHSLNLEGGSGIIRYGFNMNYTGSDGVMKASGRDNAGAELYLQFTFGSVNIKNTVSYSNTRENDSPYGSFSDYTHKLPYERTHDDNGNPKRRLPFSGAFNDKNPLYEAQLGNFSKRKSEELIDNLEVRWNVNEYFRVTGQLSFTKRWNTSDRFVDPLSLNSSVQVSQDQLLAGDLYTNDGNMFNTNARVGISYNRSIGKHNLNFTFNGELLQDKSNSLSTQYVGFASGKLNSPNHATEVKGKPTSNESTSRSAGLTGIFNYSFDNIYLADVSARYEGSSMFGENQKGSPFWSGGLGINIHNYEFMSKATAISRLKVRASYGQTGNINFPPYAAQNYYESLYDDWYITGFGTQIKYLGNPDLKTETTNTLDAGIDMSLFNDRLTVVASYYNKTTVDMINDVTIPSSSGFKFYKDNLGKVSNIGYEFEVYGTLFQKKDFSLTVNANLASNQNKLVDIAESLKNYNERVDNIYTEANGEYSKSLPFRKYEEGGSMTSIFGMKSLGIDPQTGKEVFLDRGGNVVYDWVAGQQRILGDSESKAQGAFGLNTRYKNLSLYASFTYQFGGQAYNQTLVDNVENANIKEYNVDKRVLTDRWRKPGDISPLKDIKDTETTYPSSRFVQDYNVLSFNSLSIQYEFGDKVLKPLHLERMRLEASCNDVFRVSSVKQERGLSYPFARSFHLSLMLNF